MKLKLIVFLLIPHLIFANCVIENEECSNGISQNWETINFRQISFDIPSVYKSSVDLANTNQYTWLVNNERISITIDVGNIPNGKGDLKISELIPNIYSFAEEVNNGNRNDFSDFKRLSQQYIKLGNTDAVLINQQSKLVSGKNKLFNVHSYFVTAKPHFYSIVISYDQSSYNDRKIAERIAASFVFPSNSSNSISKDEPSLNESLKWLINKLSGNLVEYFKSTDIVNGPITIWKHYYQSVSSKDGNLIIEYKEKINRPKGYGKIGFDTTIENIRVIIPFKKINSNDFNKSRSYSGKCKFEIYTDSNSIIKMNLTTGKKTFETFYEFAYDCSEEEDLGIRMNTAILHIKKLMPTKTAKKKETF